MLLLINIVTGSRLVMALPVAALVPWSAHEAWAMAASLVLILSIEVSDIVDGALARKINSTSQFGKVFDPYADSISRLIIYWSLAVLSRCLYFVPLVMAIRDVTVAYARMVMMRRGMDVSARYTGKLKAVVQGICAFLLMAGPLYWRDYQQVVVITLSSAVIIVTVASMIDYGVAALKESRASTQPPASPRR
jgi:CDP-diacylglycerol--glycerol-3-phosphate 3-phosphatidyltransferase